MINQHEDILAILVRNIAVNLHHHHAVQLVVSLDDPYQGRCCTSRVMDTSFPL
jgi:hypothetical protein